MSPEPFDARYWREAYEALVKQTGRDLNDGYGVDPRKADPAPFHLDALQVATAKLSEVMEENARLREALEPFAAAWDAVGEAWQNETGNNYKRNGRRTAMQARVEPEHFRRARSLLSREW